MKLIFIFSFAILFFSATAQKIGINTPSPIMALDVNSEDSAALLLTNIQTFADSVKTALYFKTGDYYTGAIKTHVQSASNQLARLGFFTYGTTVPNILKERMSILDNGNVGIGTTSPTALLEINGTIKINGGSPGANKVLTSNAFGNASWQAAATPPTPVVHVYMAGGNIVMQHNITYQVEFTRSAIRSIDPDNAFNEATDEYVIPSTGIYNFYANFLFSGNNSTPLVRMSIYVYNSAGTFKTGYVRDEILVANFSSQDKNLEHTFSLVAGDKVRILISQISSPGTTVTLQNSNTSDTYFRGFKIR